MEYEPLYEIDYEAVRQRNLAYARQLSLLQRMQSLSDVSLRPYRDESMDLSCDPYAGDINSSDEDRGVDDRSVKSYVNKLLFNAALDINNEHLYDQHAEMDMENLYPEWIRRTSVQHNGNDDAYVRSSFESEPGIKYNRIPRRNPNRELKRRRRRSFEDKGTDKFPFCISGHKDGHPLFTASVYQLRDYIKSEVETKVRNIHHYYEDQFQVVNKERMNALVQLIKTKDICLDLQKRLEQAEFSLEQYKSMCDDLSSQVQSGKAARRRRRLAKKHRKTGPSASPFGEIGDGDKNNVVSQARGSDQVDKN